MGSVTELIEAPLDAEQLARRYRALAEDPRFANLPGKIELDVWGRILVSPASNLHGLLQARLIQCLAASGGEAIAEASVATAAGILVADVAWMSPETATDLGTDTPYPRAPDLCVEIVSPANSRKEIDEKIAAYVGAGAKEVWVVYPRARRVDCFGPAGRRRRPEIRADVSRLFDSL